MPHPLGPISDTISPAATDSEKPSRASMLAPSGARNYLLTSEIDSDDGMDGAFEASRPSGGLAIGDVAVSTAHLTTGSRPSASRAPDPAP